MTMINHHIYGRGRRRIIALHGLFDTASYFDEMLSVLDPELWSVALPDIRGFGRSIGSAGPFDMQTIASDALRLADHLGWERFSVVGHSMCGKAALRLAIDAGGRVNAVVGITPIWAAPVSFDEQSLAFFRGSATDVEKRDAIISQSTGNLLSRHWSRSMAQRSFEQSSQEAYACYVESFLLDDFEAEASRMAQDVFVVVGARDSLTEEMVRATWGTKLQSSQITVLPDCGHWPMLEAPVLLGSMIERFLLSACGSDPAEFLTDQSIE